MTTLETFRLIATEFEAISDDDIEDWIELVKPLISEKKFGNTYNMALALLVAHKLKMAGYGDTSTGRVDDALRVNSYSEGEVSISYSASQSGSISVDAEYTLTAYGLQFLGIRRSKIIPILSAGEAK